MSTSQITASKPSSAPASRGGKYLTFALDDEEYGLEILKVREIIGYMDITSIPRVPPYIKGVINLRGQIIPVMDLRVRFGMPVIERTEQTCIIVVEMNHHSRTLRCGLIVDRVSEVLSIGENNIEPSPDFGSSDQIDFVLGVGKVGSSVKLLLDVDRIVGADGMSVAASTRNQS